MCGCEGSSCMEAPVLNSKKKKEEEDEEKLLLFILFLGCICFRDLMMFLKKINFFLCI